MSTKSSTPASAPFNRRADVSRQITSEHISAHMAAFKARGGTVEVLGNTPMLKNLKPAEPVAAAVEAAPAAAPIRGTRRAR
ncbi:MAG: hypothetical protein ACOY37_06415 [Pseudomonadota bacterium]